MTYKLFIDDERYPADNCDPAEWVIARSFADVKRVISVHGWPLFISFDHDLGEREPSGKDIANWIVDCDMNSNVLDKEFSFTVHSQNPVGAQNIEMFLGQYLGMR